MHRIRRAVRYYLLKFLRLRGTPWKVAIGFALGACINFYPTFGFGVLLAGLLASAFRVSITGALLGDLIFKSLFPFFFYLNMLVGNLLLGKSQRYTWDVVKRFTKLSFSHLRHLSEEFFLGAGINTIILGTTLTMLVYLLFRHYRHQMAHFVYKLRKRTPIR